MLRSLKGRLVGFWILSAVTCVALAGVMLGLYLQTEEQQLRHAQDRMEQACGQVAAEFRRDEAGNVASLLQGVLRGFEGIEGGLWRVGGGFFAYAFPTHMGGAERLDLPLVEKPIIETLALQVVEVQIPRTEVTRGSREALLVHACPARGGAEPVVAWTMTRVPLAPARVYQSMMLGLAILLAFVFAAALLLGRLMQTWTRKLDRLEQALVSYSLESFPQLPPSGERELDRIIAALNDLSHRFTEARERSMQLSRTLAQADRLAVIGRTAAGLAHEIRNPLATIRLKAENALAQPGARATEALLAVLVQVERLDTLLKYLLTLSKPIHPQAQPVQIAFWLEERFDVIYDQAHDAGIALDADIEPPDLSWAFDPQWVARAVDNLLLNALQHTPNGGSVTVEVRERDKRLHIAVRDNGSGVPADVRTHLFEPFVTTRAEGTGLGLALVREIAEAHGGRVQLSETVQGAEFVLELP